MNTEEVEKDLAFLRNYINRILDDSGQPYIKQGAVFPNGDIRSERFEFIKELEARGIVKILGDPFILKSDDFLLQMLTYIDRESAIPGFLDS